MLNFLHKGKIMIKNMLQEHVETDQQKMRKEKKKVVQSKTG